MPIAHAWDLRTSHHASLRLCMPRAKNVDGRLQRKRVFHKQKGVNDIPPRVGPLTDLARPPCVVFATTWKIRHTCLGGTIQRDSHTQLAQCDTTFAHNKRPAQAEAWRTTGGGSPHKVIDFPKFDCVDQRKTPLRYFSLWTTQKDTTYIPTIKR